MQVTGKTKIFRKDFDGKAVYSRRIAWQEYKDGQKGGWLGIYEPVKMPKGVDIPDGSIIQVKEAFESGYKKKDGSLERQLIIMDFDLEEKDGFQELEEQLPF